MLQTADAKTKCKHNWKYQYTFYTDIGNKHRVNKKYTCKKCGKEKVDHYKGDHIYPKKAKRGSICKCTLCTHRGIKR